ncbi:NAD(P)H-dependent oxidoreductase [Flammeovirga agarivorans]|uniref:NAD(P)H-dependent oxidoreductase n=1 Tax=Flammeovirga agarivorans TaxID=2726742 RepID=A0A7X8SQE9_9BACT|nr:NAD(P)H-dependent oxidoreductase [Flammeovirga agarivorans]NLR94483.1 NAD(P)H-dependent oxidoreductase [Flammeovirga agarivorans]
MAIINSLKWRAAVRKFDTSKKVNAQDIETLLEAGNLTATSMGLQPFKIIVIQNEALQQELVPLSYHQQQVGDASHLLVFAIETEIGKESIDQYIQRAMDIRNVPYSSLEGYHQSVSGYISQMDEKTKKDWATKQAYIALGTVMTAAAELHIDSCAMEGFDTQAYQEKLGLDKKNLLPVVILPIGYRSDEDTNSKLPKVRKNRDEFVIEMIEPTSVSL